MIGRIRKRDSFVKPQRHGMGQDVMRQPVEVCALIEAVF